MVNYSITDLEKITGIKAHTIRIWEKRYDIVKPERTSTNIRYYSDNDLKKLLNISMLNRYGYRISSIVKMSTDELNGKVMDISETSTDYILQIEHLIVAMMELNEDKFEKVLSNSLIKLGFENTVTNIIYPFLEKIGILWLVGTINPAHEHFIVSLIRQKLIAAIDGLMVTPAEKARKFLLFLPPDEMHELSLLYYWYILKKKGHRVIYFGQSLPLDDLKTISEIQNPDYVISVITTAQTLEQYRQLINTLSRVLPETKILLTGLQTREHDIMLPGNISIIDNPAVLPEMIS
jgi:DNA-binding transcriptional MerR regulator